MTKNLGRDFVYGHESSKPAKSVGSRQRMAGVIIPALLPLVAMSAALLIGGYFFG